MRSNWKAWAGVLGVVVVVAILGAVLAVRSPDPRPEPVNGLTGGTQPAFAQATCSAGEVYLTASLAKSAPGECTDLIGMPIDWRIAAEETAKDCPPGHVIVAVTDAGITSGACR